MGELKVLGGPSRDGGVIGRWVKDLDSGELRTETWRGPERGWEEGGINAATVLRSPRCSPGALKRLGVPPEDF